MRAVIQKTVGAKVDVVSENGTETCGKIDGGFVVLLGVTHSDTEKDARYVADKIAHLRVFEDEAGKLNLSLKDVGGSVLLVSQFTLYADAASGRRPAAVIFESRTCRTGKTALSAYGRTVARARDSCRNRAFPHAYAGVALQRRAGNYTAGLFHDADFPKNEGCSGLKLNPQ